MIICQKLRITNRLIGDNEIEMCTENRWNVIQRRSLLEGDPHTILVYCPIYPSALFAFAVGALHPKISVNWLFASFENDKTCKREDYSKFLESLASRKRT